tara:strand:- start:1514 stop:2290 length:777 start_codon:yes stop_codon:yes gene_type:complete
MIENKLKELGITAEDSRKDSIKHDEYEIDNAWNDIFSDLEIEKLDDIYSEIDSDIDDTYQSLENAIRQWYNYIVGSTGKGSKNLKIYIKNFLIHLFPKIENQISTIRITIEDQEIKNKDDHTVTSLLNAGTNIVITIKENNLIDPSFLNLNTEQLLVKMREHLRINDISINFKTRDPKERFMDLKKIRLQKIKKAFKMIERLDNKKYYSFEGKSKELISIKNEIFDYTKELIRKYEGDKAANEFSDKISNSSENDRPF